MKIAGIQKLSLVDYDTYTCTTLFTSGCNFFCPFCHNSRLVYQTEELLNDDYIFEFLSKKRRVIDAVCVSGGEPTLHSDLPDYIRRIKELGYLVKLDTNGTNPSMLKSLIDEKLIDYVAMDIKNSPNKYQQTSGVPIDISCINTSINILQSGTIPYEFRTTLIDGHHTEKDIIEIAKWIKKADKFFLQKFSDSGECIASGLNSLPKSTAQSFAEILSETIPDTQLRGY